MATITAHTPVQMADPDFWRAQFPGLTLSDEVQVGDLLAATQDPRVASGQAERMQVDGYMQGRHPLLEELAPRLADATRSCVAMGLPPVFLFVFDEVWRAFYALAPALSPFLGSPPCALPDFWIWHVDPARGEAGWSPHVDKGGYALAPDGTPLSATVWIPLSAATPLNSCIYLLPKSGDSEYGVPPDQRRFELDVTKVRALPAAPGEWLCWNQAILHWGSASSRFAEEPRISMALEFQSASVPPFNTPLIRDPGELNFARRLQLVAKQILQYRHMYAVDPAVERLAQSILPGVRF